jgi:hypothetical protein
VSAYRSTRFELGSLQRRHATPFPVRPLIVFFGIMGLPGIALLCGFQSAPGQVFAGDRSTNVLIGGAMLAFAVYCSRLVLGKGTLSIAVHENGFVWREKGERIVVPWTELVSIRGRHVRRLVVGAEVARTTVHRIRIANGRELVATSMLEDVDELAAKLEEILERRLPELRDALGKDRPVGFGPHTIDRAGMEHAGRRVPWSSIASIEVEKGVVVISAPERIEVEWSSIPNARLFLLLASELRSSGEPEASHPHASERPVA